MPTAPDTFRPLRIGILCHPTYGGSGVVASELALTLAERGHGVHLFSYQVPPRLARSGAHVEMHVAQGVPYPLFHTTPHDLAITSAVLNVHRDQGLDILHAHYALPHAVSAFLARSAICADQDPPAPALVTTLHGTDITLVGNDPSYAPLTRFVIEASDAITAVSADLERRTRSNFDLDSKKEIEVVPNFVDIDLYKPLPEEGPRVPTAVHVSNFRGVKRVPWLVKAFAMATAGREAQLVLVGDGPDMGDARRVAREEGIGEKVVFLGARDVLPELLAPADVFVLASREESFGLSALEAMSCGTAVVATRVGGVGEVVEHGETGLLSEVDDQQGFADHLGELLFDAERSASMGRLARHVAEQCFERHMVVERYEDLYHRLLGRPGC